LQEPIELRAAVLGSTPARIYVFSKDLPAAAGGVVAQLPELHLAALVRGTDADVLEEIDDSRLKIELTATVPRLGRSGLAKFQLPYRYRRRVKHKLSVTDAEILKVPE